MSTAWDCPFCNRIATLSEDDITGSSLAFDDSSGHNLLIVNTKVIVCPNPSCKQYAITAELREGHSYGSGWVDGKFIQSWRLRPQSQARPYPEFIPKPIRDDYVEACLIRDFSPKASATLSRRCLQGMIRDFWKVKKPNLYQEINAIEDKVEPAIWQAIDAVRSIGNIGAHMENDINLVIDVDPDEAQTLIQLIEVLFDEWYVRRKQREDHLASIVAIADSKKAAKAAKSVVGAESDKAA